MVSNCKRSSTKFMPLVAWQKYLTFIYIYERIWKNGRGWYFYFDYDKMVYKYNISLRHPSLGWFYVFSSFPPPRPRPPPPPPPPPQWLLLLTSKPFHLGLRYLGQRKYGSWEMYWVTFGWPWLKVTAVTLINKNLLVCRIKWELLNQTKRRCIGWILDELCDLDLWPHPWSWPLLFQGQI